VIVLQNVMDLYYLKAMSLFNDASPERPQDKLAIG